MLVPEPFPDGEEEAGDPEAKERRDTQPLQAADDGVIYGDVEQAKRHELLENFFMALLAS